MLKRLQSANPGFYVNLSMELKSMVASTVESTLLAKDKWVVASRYWVIGQKGQKSKNC